MKSKWKKTQTKRKFQSAPEPKLIIFTFEDVITEISVDTNYGLYDERIRPATCTVRFRQGTEFKCNVDNEKMKVLMEMYESKTPYTVTIEGKVEL